MGDTRDRIAKPTPAVSPFQGSLRGFRHRRLKPRALTWYGPLGGREAAGPVRGRNNLSPRLQWEKGAVRGIPGRGDTRDRIAKPTPSGAAASGLLGLARYNVIEYTRSISWPLRARAVGSHAPTRQQNYQTNPISSNPKGINGLRLVSRACSADLALFQRPRRWAACSADLALFQRPRPWAATEQQNDQTNPIPHKDLFYRHLRKVWRADRVLLPQRARNAGLVLHFINTLTFRARAGGHGMPCPKFPIVHPASKSKYTRPNL